MNYGMYLSAGGALTSMHRLDVVANNLANVNTMGFKPDAVMARARLPERIENPKHADAGRHMLESLGGGLFVEETSVQLGQGSLQMTGDDLDIAVQGEGFLVVSDPRAASTDQRLALTRDGRLTLDRGGMLITASSGQAVLDTQGQPIRLDGVGKVTILRNGELLQDGERIARINLVSPGPRTKLIKTGENLFRFSKAELQASRAADGSILQGAIEASAVDPVMELNKLIAASKAVQGNLKMMQYHDQIMGQAINTFGRVA
jgi:flagellar basal-body rod protein FlgF